MCVSESQIPECFCKGKGGLLFKDRDKILSLHYCPFSKLLHGEGRTTLTSAPLSSSLPVREEGTAVPEILSFLCVFFGLSKSVCKYLHISKCVPGISAHVPYFIFISPGAVRPKSHYTILFTNVKKITLKTRVNLQIGKKTSGWTWTVLTAVCGLVTGNPAD